MAWDTRNRTAGFTLVELLVALGISALVLTILTRLLSVSLFSSTMQDQLAEMNQNARYAIREFGDLLMQAGADLQSNTLDTLDKDTIIFPDGNTALCSGFTIKINPRGGIRQISQTNHAAICSMEVEDARKFRLTNQLERIPGEISTLPLKFYTLQKIDTIKNFIFFSPADSFILGDALCTFVKKRFFLNGTDICIDRADIVIAENIDSLAIRFLDKEGNPTARWVRMRSVELLVRSKTTQPDPRYTGYDDHCRRVTLTYKFRLRNKAEQ